jgi:hypothetical protein
MATLTPPGRMLGGLSEVLEPGQTPVQFDKIGYPSLPSFASEISLLSKTSLCMVDALSDFVFLESRHRNRRS